ETTQIAPTNFDLCHASLISDYVRQGSGGLPAPLLLRLSACRLARRILHFEPVRRSSRDVARVLALRHNAFRAERLRVLEHGCAIEVAAVDPFVEHQPGLSIGK